MWPLFTEKWGSWRNDDLHLSPCPFTVSVSYSFLFTASNKNNLCLEAYASNNVCATWVRLLWAFTLAEEYGEPSFFWAQKDIFCFVCLVISGSSYRHSYLASQTRISYCHVSNGFWMLKLFSAKLVSISPLPLTGLQEQLHIDIFGLGCPNIPCHVLFMC